MAGDGEDVWNFDVDEEYGDEESDRQGNLASRECMVMMVDASKSMMERSLQDSEQSLFAVSMEAVYNYMRKSCVSCANDYIAIVVYNTAKTENGHKFEHIYVLQEAMIPGADEVKALEPFLHSEAGEAVTGSFGGSGECGLDEAFWLANSILTTGSAVFGTKRVMAFTDCDAPHPGNPALLKRVKQKLRDLSDQDVVVDLVPLRETFDGGLFWAPSLGLEELNLSHGLATIEDLRSQ